MSEQQTSAGNDAPAVKSSGEPIDLLAALQRSIDAAKRDRPASTEGDR